MLIHFNILSLLLGLLAWGIAVLGICKKRNVCFPSFTACALALLLQLLEIRRRVDIGDISAVYDTIEAVCLAAGVLITVTVVLNLIAVLPGKK